MKLLDLLHLQQERLQAAAEVFQSMLNDRTPNDSSWDSLINDLVETVYEINERKKFITEVKQALDYCTSYREIKSVVSFAGMRESFTKLFVLQEHPLARRYLPRLSPLGARAGCRSCANMLLSSLETHLLKQVQDDFSLKA